MTRGLWLLTLFSLALTTAPAWGAAVNVTSETLLRVYQRDTVEQSDQQVIPLYEYLTLTSGERSGEGLSLHLRGWVRGDLAGSDLFADRTDGELLYAYLQYARSDRRLDLRAGRQQLFDGIALETLDGLRVQSELRAFTLLAYGGQPAAYDEVAGRSGDSLYGGRIGYRSRYGALGLSAKESRNDGERVSSLLGGDLSLPLPAGVDLTGYSTYNRDTAGWREHAYRLRIPLGTVTLTPFFERYAFSDYFDQTTVSATPFRSLAASDATLTAYGSDLGWQPSARWEVGGRYKVFDQSRDGRSADYRSLRLAWRGQALTQVGIEGGTMDGDDAADRYLLTRFFFYADGLFAQRGFLSGDLLNIRYDQPVYGEDRSLCASLSIGRRFLDDALELKLSGDYSRDPYFDRDVKGMLVALYRFAAGNKAKGATP